jgi:2-polyprenyl-3-methyl-5-hydroxy-6-metoxy-1,4-benzoquinol methylase
MMQGDAKVMAGNGVPWDPNKHYQDVAIAERYDRERFSSVAGRVFNRLERSVLRAAFADVPRTARVLDLPCGTGRLAETLLQEGFRVEGADISAAMLEVARRKLERFGPAFTTRVGDVRELAQRERGTYDVGLCARVLMHFPLAQQVEFLRSVATLVKGRVVFSQSLSTPYHRARRQLKRVLRHANPARYPITEDELRELLAGAGLREVRRLRLNRLVSEAVMVVTEHR